VTYDQDQLLALSGIQHFVYCPRQAALIHVEGQWADNSHTVHGTHMHNRVHDAGPRRERRGDLIIVRGLALRSEVLGLVGVSDLVEFHRTTDSRIGVHIDGVSGLWLPYPVEYKRGRPKPHLADSVQLCAQAMCMEEMLGAPIAEGALFYGKTKRRQDVAFDEHLRMETTNAAKGFHDLVEKGETPPAESGKKCSACSLAAVCLPRIRTTRSVKVYLTRTLAEMASEYGEGE